MAVNNRPSLDSLVPLVMIETSVMNESDEDISCEPSKDVLLRSFESGDIVLVRLESQCLPAIVFNISGLVMKFDIDRQLYHVCLLDKGLTEQWVDATDMIIYSVPMIAECQDEQTILMWSTANELLAVSNTDEDRIRLEEFKRRFNELRCEQIPLAALNISKKSKKTPTPFQKSTPQRANIYSPLTTCEELHVIDSIYQLSHCTYADAQRIAEETYTKIICTNNRENIQSNSIGMIPDQWFLTFVTRKIEYFRQYSTNWLPDLQAMVDHLGHEKNFDSLVSLMKESL